MSDLSLARAALDVTPPPGLGAQVEAVASRGMVTIRGDLGDAGFAGALQAATGCAVPAVRRSTEAGDRRVLWMSTDEVMVFCPWGEASGVVAAFMDRAGDASVLALDVSDARAVFRVSGEKAWRVLAKGAPVDLERMETGEVRRTRLAQVPAAFWLHEGGATVICFRSVARYVEDILRVSTRTPVGHF